MLNLAPHHPSAAYSITSRVPQRGVFLSLEGDPFQYFSDLII